MIAPTVGLVPFLASLDLAASYGIRCGDQPLTWKKRLPINIDLHPTLGMQQRSLQRCSVCSEVEGVHPVLHSNGADILIVDSNW